MNSNTSNRSRVFNPINKDDDAGNSSSCINIEDETNNLNIMVKHKDSEQPKEASNSDLMKLADNLDDFQKYLNHIQNRRESNENFTFVPTSSSSSSLPTSNNLSKNLLNLQSPMEFIAEKSGEKYIDHTMEQVYRRRSKSNVSQDHKDDARRAWMMHNQRRKVKKCLDCESQANSDAVKLMANAVIRNQPSPVIFIPSSSEISCSLRNLFIALEQCRTLFINYNQPGDNNNSNVIRLNEESIHQRVEEVERSRIFRRRRRTETFEEYNERMLKLGESFARRRNIFRKIGTLILKCLKLLFSCFKPNQSSLADFQFVVRTRENLSSVSIERQNRRQN